jgi:hypothetical protein
MREPEREAGRRVVARIKEMEENKKLFP